MQVIALKKMTSEHWGNQINAAWQKSIEGFIETGRLLIEAKKELDHGLTRCDPVTVTCELPGARRNITEDTARTSIQKPRFVGGLPIRSQFQRSADCASGVD